MGPIWASSPLIVVTPNLDLEVPLVSMWELVLPLGMAALMIEGVLPRAVTVAAPKVVAVAG